MRIIFTFLLLFASSNSSFSQDCYPDYHHASGGMHPFRTYRQSQTPYEPLEGICSQSQNGIVHSYFEFKKGQIMVHRSYDHENGKLTGEFKRVNKDSIFAESFTKPDGIHLEEKKTYYLNKQGKRCWKEEKYIAGKLSQVSYYRNFTVEELANSGNCYSKNHESDSEGYSGEYAPFGKETKYHPNGKIMSVSELQLIISDRSYDYHGRTQHGKYFLYAENGVEIERGTYANGQQNGEFIYHHPNGKLAAKKYFTNGIPTGHWIEYYEDGKPMSTADYGDQYYENTGHEKRYFHSGKLQYESMMKRDSVGFRSEFYENGNLKEQSIHRFGSEEKAACFKYFPNGTVQQKTYYFLAPTDTASVEYYADGFLKSIYLRFKENYRQETRNYFANHNLENETYTEVVDGTTHHLYNEYNENGKKHIKWETHGKYFNSKEYWSNGRLKCDKQFERIGIENLLNGYWIEQDSLGNVTKKCRYVNGFRSGECEVKPVTKLAPLTAEQEKCLLPLAVHQITQRKYDTNIIIDDKRMNEEVNVLRKVEQFLISTYFSKFQFNCDQNQLTTFQYSFYSHNGEYTQYKTQIDSIIKELKWETIGPILTGGDKSSGGRFNSTKLYSSQALDSIFNSIVPNASQFFLLENVITASVYLTDNNYYSPASISLERKESERAWLAHVHGNKVVVYDDGLIEFYNGFTFKIAQPTTYQITTVPTATWKVVKKK